MLENERTELAKIIVEKIRDAAIQSGDVQLYSTNMRSPIAKRWRDAKDSGQVDNLSEMIIADTVDDTIFYFLQAIDEGLLNLSFNDQSGRKVDLTSDIIGELGGWYMGEWRSKYSKERCSNDLDDI